MMEQPIRHWYALYVKSRHEFTTANELQRKCVETFLPSVTKLRQWKDRRKPVEFPLFPGYLFVHVSPSPDDVLNVLKTRGAVSFISLVPGNPTPVSLTEIESLKLLIESGADIDIHPLLQEGMGVRVKRGPLKSAEGVLRKKEDNDIFVVNIDILGRSVSVKIYSDDVEAA
jgi:transcription antitermination factor NusG